MMRFTSKMLCAFSVACMFFPAAPAARPSALPQGKTDYLTDSEADKVRDAINPSDRIKLYISFADDRLKKLQYELTRTTPERRRTEIVNGLINAYDGCLGDATDQIDDAKEKQVDIHASLKLLESKSKEFLEALQKIQQAGGPDFDAYKQSLSDAIDDTKDAISSSQKAGKEMLPAPVRRKPS